MLLVRHLTIRQSRLLTVLGLYKTVLTDWRASRWLNTDYSQSYSRSSTDGTLSSRGRRSRRECSNYRRGRGNLSCHGNCRGSFGSCGSEGSRRSQGRSRGSRGSRRSRVSLGSCRSRGSWGHQESRRSRVSLGSCRSRRNRESRSTGSRGRGQSRWSQERRRSYRSRRYCESRESRVSPGSCRESCQGWCGRSKKIEYCQGLRSRDSGSDPALELAVFECTRFERVETKLRDRLPPESLGKRMQQHLCPLVLDHHAALGDYSADVMVGAEK